MRAALVIALAALAALALAAPSSVAAEAPSESARAAYAQSCRHYDNRARFTPRPSADPLARLADGCAAAFAALGDAEPARRSAAETFLDRLTDARERIADINRARARGEGNQLRVASADARAPLDLARALGLVTPAGEHLILRSAGVFDALDAWEAVGAVSR